MIDNENQEQFDQPIQEFDELGEEGKPRGQLASNVAEAWRTKPLFKLLVLMVGAGALVAALIGLLSPKPELDASRVGMVPAITEPPGGKGTPAFIEAQQRANEQRLLEQAAIGESALPTPLPSGLNVDTRPKGNDPLIEFKAELERQKEEQRKQIQALQQQNQQQQQVATAQQDQQIQERYRQSMQTQMKQLFDLWKPKSMVLIKGSERTDKEKDGSAQGSAASAAGGASSSSVFGGRGSTGTDTAQHGIEPKDKKPALIPAGTVSYAQMLTAANSDVPGPILAQILSGPLSGARAIGEFVVQDEYLTMKFNLAILKDKEYKISALALDPDTTLGGMATEVDHRYITRVVLPAAAAFVSELGKALGQKPETITVTNGVVITQQASTGLKDGLYAGMGAAGESLANFFASEANRTKVLVLIAAGTPFGMFFTAGVCPGEYPCSAEMVSGNMQDQMPGEQGQAGFPVMQAPPPQAAMQQPIYPQAGMGRGGYGAPGGGAVYYPTTGATMPGYGYRQPYPGER